MLFCPHAEVGHDHIDISAKVCPAQPFHWYIYEGGPITDSRTGEKFVSRWGAICQACENEARNDAEVAFSLCTQNEQWIGEPPVIIPMC